MDDPFFGPAVPGSTIDGPFLGAALGHLAVVVEVAVVVDAIELQKAVLRIVAILHGLVVANAIRLAFSIPEIVGAPPVRSIEK